MKKTRQAVAKSIENLHAHKDALIQLGAAINLHNRVLSAPFAGRLRWLLTGRIPPSRVRGE
jgi:hypothetical protein